MTDRGLTLLNDPIAKTLLMHRGRATAPDLAFADATLASTASIWHVETTIGSDYVLIVFTLRGVTVLPRRNTAGAMTHSRPNGMPSASSGMARVQSRAPAVVPFGDLFDEWRNVTLRAAHASTRYSRQKERYYRSWQTAKFRRIMTRLRMAQRKYSDVRTAANRAALS